jgi:hypothetical protein
VKQNGCHVPTLSTPSGSVHPRAQAGEAGLATPDADCRPAAAGPRPRSTGAATRRLPLPAGASKRSGQPSCGGDSLLDDPDDRPSGLSGAGNRASSTAGAFLRSSCRDRPRCDVSWSPLSWPT